MRENSSSSSWEESLYIKFFTDIKVMKQLNPKNQRRLPFICLQNNLQSFEFFGGSDIEAIGKLDNL